MIGNSDNALATFTRALSNWFSLKELGAIHYFLRVEAIPTATCIHLSQQKYILDLLDRMKMNGAKDVSTPMSAFPSLSLHDGIALSSAIEFRKVVGSLQYLSLT